MITAVAEKKVMVVEDESIISLDIKNSLRNLGYAVTGVAASGDSALRKIESNLPDLVLMDIHLKGDMTGIEVSEQIKSTYQIPVIYLTANADSATFQSAKHTSPYGYLLKPFEEKELGMAIEIALHKYEQELIVRSSESWYASAFQSINEAVVATDLDGCIVFLNPYAESITGWRLTDVLDKPLEEILVFQRKIQQFDQIALKKSVGSILEAVLRGRQTVPFPHGSQLTTQHGEAIAIEGNATAIRDAEGHIVGSLFIFKDAPNEVVHSNETDNLQQPHSAPKKLTEKKLTEKKLTEKKLASTLSAESNSNEMKLITVVPYHELPDATEPEPEFDIEEEIQLSDQEKQELLESKEQELAADKAVIESFTQAFIHGKPVAKASRNLLANSENGLTTLSCKEEGLIVRITTIEEQQTAIVKQTSKHANLIQHVLIEHSFFPISRRTSGHFYYQHRHIPDRCQIYHTDGAAIWEAWHGRRRPGQTTSKIDALKLSRDSIIVLRRGKWYRILKMVFRKTGLHIKTIGGEIFVPPDESLIWGIKA